MSWQPVLFAFAVSLAAAIAGCGTNSAPAVHGKVTLDGESVTEGNIAFIPQATKGPKAAAVIEQGAYAIAPQIKLPPGKYRVEISWRKPTGRKIPSADPGITIDETREAMPPKFNAESTLTAEITPANNERDFVLTTK